MALFGSAEANPLANILTGLAACWTLNEYSDGSGAVQRNDSVGTNHLADDPLRIISSPSGIVGRCIDIVPDRLLTCVDSPTLRTGDIDFTVAGWVRFDVIPASNMAFISKYNSGGATREWRIEYIPASTCFGFRVSRDGTASSVVNASTFGLPVINTWYFIVGWHDAVHDTLNIQINNGVVNSLAYTNGVMAGGAAKFVLGGQDGNGSSIDGRIDEVGFWKRVLTAAERTALYNGGTGKTYPFDVPTIQTRTLITASNNTLAYAAARVPHQRQCFYAAGRYWVFYGDYNNATGPFDLYFTSSADGISWSAPTNLTTFPICDAQWSVCFDGSKLHVIKCIQSGAIFHDGLYYRRGTPNADGTITWDAAWQTAIAAGNKVGDASLAVDTAGLVWVGYDNSNSAKVTKNSANDGTWTTAAGFPIELTNGIEENPILSPLAGGAMYATVYRWNSDIAAKGYSLAASGAITSEGNITTSNVEADSGAQAKVGRIEAASLSDGKVHLAYQTSAQTIVYRLRNVNGTFAGEVQLSDNSRVAAEISSPRISFDANGNVYVTWSGNNKIYLTTNKSGSWSTPAEIVSEALQASYEHFMPDEKVTNGRLPAVWLTSTYTLKWMAFGV